MQPAGCVRASFRPSCSLRVVPVDSSSPDLMTSLTVCTNQSLRPKAIMERYPRKRRRQDMTSAAVEDSAPSSPPVVNIKEEPIDEGYDSALLPQTSTKTIKQETDPHQEELKISSVYSLRGGENTFIPPPAPPPAPVPQPSPPPPPGPDNAVGCSGCSKVLLKGQTALQRKGSTQLFCSTVCLTGYLPPTSKARSCHQCLKDISQPKDMIIFCSMSCLSDFIRKKKPEKIGSMSCCSAIEEESVPHPSDERGDSSEEDEPLAKPEVQETCVVTPARVTSDPLVADHQLYAQAVEEGANSKEEISGPNTEELRGAAASCEDPQVQRDDKEQTAPAAGPVSCYSTGVEVMTLKKKEDGGRQYNKKFYCLFCFKPFNKMARHLESKHRDKAEVAAALAFRKGSTERRVQLALLRNRGNRVHNERVIQEGRGVVVPKHQSSIPSKASQFMHCINCEAYLRRKTLWRHLQKCQLSKKTPRLFPGRTRVQSLCSQLQPVPDGVNTHIWKLVCDMNQDEATMIIRQEKNILRLGEHMFRKHGHDCRRHDYIKQKMRVVGRLLLQGQRNGKLMRMADFFVPNNFVHVVEAVMDVAGFNKETGTYKTPSLVLRLGYMLKQMANMFECDARMSGDSKCLHNVQLFKQITYPKWSECLSNQAHRMRLMSKKITQLLPFTDAVKKMHHYLSDQRKKRQTKLEQEPDKIHWAELAKLTLCEVIFFNRRTVGEVSKITLNSFISRNTSWIQPDFKYELSELEKRLCNYFQHIKTEDKHGRQVPVLLTPSMLASMELLARTRRRCHVPDENHFLFGIPELLTHFSGSDAIRQVALKCGAKVLHAAKLRKKITAICIVLNLQDHEIHDLSDFLGPGHRGSHQDYRLPEGTLQLMKISKLFLALERGQRDVQGMSLSEVNIDPNEEVTMDSSASEAEEDEGVTVMEAVNSPLPSGRSDGGKAAVEDCSGAPETTKVKSRAKRQKWAEEEIEAVEKTLLAYIKSKQLPGKKQCVRCIESSPDVLRRRTWTGIKFYIKNRISAMRRDEMTQGAQRTGEAP